MAKVLTALKKQKIGKKKFKYDYSIVYSTPWAPHVDIEERHYRFNIEITHFTLCRDHSDGSDIVNAHFTYTVLVKGVF